MKSRNTIAISKSYFPEEQMSYTEWVQKFNVGTNVPLNYGRSIECDLNREYDFNKLFKKPSHGIFNFSWILEKLNIFA